MTGLVVGRPRVGAPLLLAGFAVAVGLRVAVGGPAVAGSASAGLVFAGALAVLTLAVGTTGSRLSWSALGWGVAGAVVLLVPPFFLHLSGTSHTPGGAFLPWALVVAIVATAEEAFLRGALFGALGSGPVGLVVTSVCFALLHVPLYGWHVVPLDFAVGLWLGALRRTTGTWTAPAISHTLADLAAWWLR
jgi:Type II CAAX prenyl endopeptidase Rce1-like